MNLHLRRLLLACALLGCSAAHAQTGNAPPRAEDFAWQWPLSISPGQDVVRITLTPAVYAQLAGNDLADLAAFGGNGTSLPLGPLPTPSAIVMTTTPAATVALPMFTVPTDIGEATEGLQLHIQRDADGRLRQLHAQIEGKPGATAQSGPVLLDLSALHSAVRGLDVQLSSAAQGSLNARVEISGSRDLELWHPIGGPQALVSLQQGEFRLQRLQLRFPGSDWPYLRLRRIDAGEGLPLQAVLAVTVAGTRSVDEHATLPLQGSPVADAPGSFEYRLDGPFPVSRVSIELAERNALASVVIESRAKDDAAWRERARGTAFRLAGATEDYGADAFELNPLRDRHWHLRSEPPLAQAPRLIMGYRQESFVLLAQGPGPYRLVAGSASARRPEYPLAAVLATLKAQHGADWQPPELVLGKGAALAGEAARTPPPAPPPLRQWLLWGVLTAAAGLLGFLAVRLLREKQVG